MNAQLQSTRAPRAILAALAAHPDGMTQTELGTVAAPYWNCWSADEVPARVRMALKNLADRGLAQHGTPALRRTVTNRLAKVWSITPTGRQALEQ